MKTKITGTILLLCFCYTVKSQQTPFFESFDNDTIAGVKGTAKLFDGFFTSKQIPLPALPNSENLTIEAWVGVQEYATNVAAITDREAAFKSGYLFGINQYGNLTASASVNGQWTTCTTEEAVPLLQWTHVAMVIENTKAISLYINGKKVGSITLSGTINFCDTCQLSIGKTQTATAATNTEKNSSISIKTYNYFDGLIDELYCYQVALTEQAIAQHFTAIKIGNPQPLHYRQMPSGPVGKGGFGAYYTRLQYSPGWDALWRGSDYPDIVVRFDNSPVRFIFWRGTSYIPAIVNEKNMWATDQSLEHYGTGECYEAMGDKQTRYSHVRIIENTPARVMVHWRYALAGIQHQLLPADEWGWSDWVDEYWTIYPDGVAARKQVLWSNRYEKDKGVMQWQETIFFCQPGARPQDNVDMNAITFMNMEGYKQSYSWVDGPPKLKRFIQPEYQPVEMINFKSVYKPYSIFNEKRICKPFSFGNMKSYTTFPNWNHWPVQQIPSDGRNAVAPDKPSHASLTDGNGNTQIVEKKEAGCYWACSLKGMTEKPIDSLLDLARSWNFAPSITNLSTGFTAAYDKYQRAYALSLADAQQHIQFTVNASATSPVYNLPLVIDNCGASLSNISLNGKLLKAGKDYVTGFIPGLMQNKQIVFIKIKSSTSLKVRINLSP